MKQVHFTLYGKGGTGKSLAASLIAQYLRYRNHEVVFASAISHPGNEGNYDYLFNRIFEEDKNFIIDSDTAEFLLLKRYISEIDLVDLIFKHGRQVVMHVVLTDDTATHSYLELMLSQVPEQTRIVVWLNEFYSEFSDFEQTDVYLKNRDRIHGLVLLEKHNAPLVNANMEKMLSAGLTFDEVSVSPDFGVLERYRLHRVKEGVFRQLEEIVG